MLRILILVFILVSSNAKQTKEAQKMDIDLSQYEQATLGAGCFWCVEAIFQRLEGVVWVESGYSGGHVPNPTYEQVCGKQTGHAEVARVYFDPKIIPFETILEVFFKTHDPTTLNQQGNDVGPQYKSVIFYHNKEQKKISEAIKSKLTDEKIWDDPIVTEISSLTNYYKAENYHQNYFNQNKQQGYCSFVITPKVEKFEKIFKNRLKK